ncbi:MAG: adenylyl-sulfate kinase [Polyangiaceae bacterium]
MSGIVVWLTGLPASGKTTFAEALRAALIETGRSPVVLDGDFVRAALVPAPGYGESERDGFYATLANLAAMLARQGLIVLVPASANRRAYRERARLVAPHFIEIYLNTSLDTCIGRDPKGLYARAGAKTNASTLPGVGAEYEAPEHPDVVTLGVEDQAAIDTVLALLA